MSTSTERRSRKRRAMRESISNAATSLFYARGFENVTVDEVAIAADVSRMTVFNHFPRKEDLFFDRDEEIRETLRDVLRQRDPSVSPIETYRLLAHRLVAEESRYVVFSGYSQIFVETIENSETLKARARAISDEVAQLLAVALSENVEREPDDSDANLAASLIVAIWLAAARQAYRIFVKDRDTTASKATFLALIDKGIKGLAFTMQDTPYA